MTVSGRTVLRRRVNPPGVMGFPRGGSPIRMITVTQYTEPGTLRATVKVDSRGTVNLPSHCFSYLPPATTVRITPR